jgi:hypothetical protein
MFAECFFNMRHRQTDRPDLTSLLKNAWNKWRGAEEDEKEILSYKLIMEISYVYHHPPKSRHS